MQAQPLRFGAILALCLPSLSFFTQTTFARDSGPLEDGGIVNATARYTSGDTGFDVSFPQCATGLPASSYAFAVVGVTNGRAFTYNPCLAFEFVWARGGSRSSPALYMNLNYPVGTRSAARAASGPKGDCEATDGECLAYNYGYNAALAAFTYAKQKGASATLWWIDVEVMNSWSPDTSLNDVVIQGALDLFSEKEITAGVYSTATQWNRIAGKTFVPDLPKGAQLPIWLATTTPGSAASRYCSPRQAFGGGSVWLVQYPRGDYDGNYAC